MLETTFHSLTAVLIVMFMVAVGWLFGKLGYLRREHKKLMTKLIISAGMPSLVVNTVFGKIDLDALQNPALLFLLPALSMIITLLLGFILQSCLNPRQNGAAGLLRCVLFEFSFVGLPMNTGLFGDEAVPYVMCFYIVNTTLFGRSGIISSLAPAKVKSAAEFCTILKNRFPTPGCACCLPSACGTRRQNAAAHC